MKRTLSLLLLTTFGFCSTALALKPGDAVKPDALGKTESIKGDLVTAWEPGKVYIIECWATWCGPCIAAIPHVDALYDKYVDKGLRVVGMNVWEEDKASAAAFVKEKGDGMSYPISHAIKGSDFEKDWLVAGGVEGIPHAFVVKDGKFLFSTHPAQLTDQLIEDLLAGGEVADKAIKKLSSAKENEEKIEPILMAFSKAAEEKNLEGMNAQIAALEAIDPAHELVPMMRMDLAMTFEKWDDALAEVDKLPEAVKVQALISISAMLVKEPNPAHPESLKRELVKRMTTVKVDDTNVNAFSLRLILSQLQWQLGEKDAALTTAKLLAASSKELPSEVSERYVKSIEDGKIATTKEVITWIGEAMQKKK